MFVENPPESPPPVDKKTQQAAPRAAFSGFGTQRRDTRDSRVRQGGALRLERVLAD